MRERMMITHIHTYTPIFHSNLPCFSSYFVTYCRLQLRVLSSFFPSPISSLAPDSMLVCAPSAEIFEYVITPHTASVARGALLGIVPTSGEYRSWLSWLYLSLFFLLLFLFAVYCCRENSGLCGSWRGDYHVFGLGRRARSCQ